MFSYYRIFIDNIFTVFVMLIAFAVVIIIFLIFVFIGKETLSLLIDENVLEQINIFNLFLPQSVENSSESGYIWQPHSNIPKFNVLPLFIGSLKITLVAIVIATPLGIIAAIYTSQFAFKSIKEIIKSIIEFLAGIPSVVLGFFALIVLGDFIQDIFNLTYRLNTLTAGIALSLAVIPIIFTLSEEALSSVPKSYLEASLALGASVEQSTFRVIFPAAVPGIFASVILGFGRAFGETMIVLMASGNAAIFSLYFTDSTRTLAATIASEMGEVIVGESHYLILFFLGFMLFVLSFILNYVADFFINRYKKRFLGLK